MAIHAESNIQLNTIPAYTSLLGGHFYYKSTAGTQEHPTPPSANVIQNASNPSNPATWGYNTHIGANGIKLRYNETDLSSWTANELAFYQPSTSNKTLSLTSNGLNFYGSSTSSPDATLTNSGLKLVKGGIEAGTPNTNNFIYLSTDEYGAYAIHNSAENDWKQIIGTNFGVRADGSMYASSGLVGGWIITDETYIETTDEIPISGKIYYVKNDNVYEESHVETNFEDGIIYYERIGASLHTGNFNQNGGTYISSIYHGSLVAADDAYKNWAITIGQNFGVTTLGTLYASDAHINGVINATSGEIGGFSVGENSLYSAGKTDVLSMEEGTYIGPLGFNVSGGTEETTTYLTANAVSIGGLLKWSLEDGNNNLTINATEIILGKDAQGRDFKVKTLLNDAIDTNNRQDVNIANNLTTITNINNFLDDYYKPYITTTTNNASGYIQLKRKANNNASSVKITDSIIELSINQNNITTYSGNLMHTTFGEFENLRMRVGTTGSLTWIARSNGHLSLKVVN